MTVVDGDILKTVMEVSLDDGTIAQSVFYHRAVLAASQANLTVTNAIETWIEGIYANLSAQLPSSMTQRLCSVNQVEWNSTDSIWETVQLIGLFTPTITFGNTGEELPNQSAAVPVFNTTRPKSRGRTFLFPFGEDQQAQSFLTSAALTAVVNFADDVLDDIVIGPLNTLEAGVVRAAANAFLIFTNAVVTNVLGTMRTRKPGVGA